MAWFCVAPVGLWVVETDSSVEFLLCLKTSDIAQFSLCFLSKIVENLATWCLSSLHVNWNINVLLMNTACFCQESYPGYCVQVAKGFCLCAGCYLVDTCTLPLLDTFHFNSNVPSLKVYGANYADHSWKTVHFKPLQYVRVISLPLYSSLLKPPLCSLLVFMQQGSGGKWDEEPKSCCF